jgi:DNA-binding transcriptional LysR family regulator
LLFTMDLRHLSSFVAVAEDLSFRLAAKRVGLSQPPLSRQIKALEEELGVRLLHRGRNSQISLTDAGMVFLKDARRTLASAESGRQHVKEIVGGTRGRLNIASVAAYSPRVLPKILENFRAEYPHVEVRLYEMQPLEQFAALSEGRLHAGILPGGLNRPLDRRLQAHVLFTCPMMAVLSPGHTLAKGSAAALDIHQLAGETLLIPGPGVGTGYTAGLRWLSGATSFVPASTQEVDGVENALSMAAAGYGVCILPKVLLSAMRHSCCLVPLNPPVPVFSLKLIWVPAAASLLLKNFVTVVQQQMPHALDA